jgi:hypothetical protein
MGLHLAMNIYVYKLIIYIIDINKYETFQETTPRE